MIQATSMLSITAGHSLIQMENSNRIHVHRISTPRRRGGRGQAGAPRPRGQRGGHRARNMRGWGNSRKRREDWSRKLPEGRQISKQMESNRRSYRARRPPSRLTFGF